jgi:hypothetical protein
VFSAHHAGADDPDANRGFNHDRLLFL